MSPKMPHWISSLLALGSNFRAPSSSSNPLVDKVDNVDSRAEDTTMIESIWESNQMMAKAVGTIEKERGNKDEEIEKLKCQLEQ